MAEPAAPAFPVHLFDHNWLSGIAVATTHETNIDENIDATEQRKGLRGKPRRQMAVRGLTMTRDDVAKVRLTLRDGTNGRLYYPLFADETLLTTDAPLGSGVLPCVVDDRRFFAGARVMIVEWSKDKRAIKHEIHTITAVLSASLDITGVLANSFSKGACIYPLFLAEVSLQQQGGLPTDRMFQYDVTLQEVVGDTALPPLVAAGTNPPNEQTWKSLPILTIPHNWDVTNTGTQRKGKQTEVGLGPVFDLQGVRGLDTGALHFRQVNRADAFRLLRFFDSRGGSNFTFWYPHRSSDLELVSKTSNFVWNVRETISATKLQEQLFVAFWMKNGTVYVRGLTLVVAGGGLLAISLSESITEAATEVDRISFACLARFDTDTVQEAWPSTKAMQTQLSIAEVPFSGDLACTGVGCEGGNCIDPEECPEPPNVVTEDDPIVGWEPGGPCGAAVTHVPMYFDLLRTWNSGREPIRAADLGMPQVVKINIKDGLVPDENHPQFGAVSQTCLDLLFQEHELEYQGTVSRAAKSRNPYHLRVTCGIGCAYGVRAGGELVEDSPEWSREYEYEIGEDTHTLTITQYIEWVLHTTDEGYAAWGAMKVWWAHTTELIYTDGTEYAPFDDIEFTTADPFVGGLYEGQPAANKYAHPRALFVAMSPTTWHSPIGYEFHSKVGRDQYRSECFRQLSGAPWSEGSENDAVNNSVFGKTTDGMRAIGSLGGWTTSEFFEWVCIENTAGTGMTYLKPTRPGWDEGTATLTLGSNDISVEVCRATGQVPINGCHGHPDDPLQDRGGTHACFRNNSTVGALDPLCFSTTGTATATIVEQCVTLKATYDEFCNIVESDCSNTQISTSFSLNVEDYTYTINSGPTGRHIRWVGLFDDPYYERTTFPGEDYCDTASPFADWQDWKGTTTPTRVGCPNGKANMAMVPAGSGQIRGFYGYAGSIQDGSIEADIPYVANSIVGFGGRVGGVHPSIDYGYFGVLNRVNNKIEIYKVTGSNTIAIVADKAVTPGEVTYRMRFGINGSRIGFTIDDLDALSIDHCELDVEGEWGPANLTSLAQAFEDVSVDDNNWKKLEVNVHFNNIDSIVSVANGTLSKGSRPGRCDTCTPEDCPGDVPLGPECNGPCTSICKGIMGIYTVNSADYPLGSAAPTGLQPPPMNTCQGESCNPPYPACATCPPPWKAYSVNLNGTCGDIETTNIWANGLAAWSWAVLVCA